VFAHHDHDWQSAGRHAAIRNTFTGIPSLTTSKIILFHAWISAAFIWTPFVWTCDPRYILTSWRQRLYDPPWSWYLPTSPHDVNNPKTNILTFTAVKKFNM
jgi:hypothetical protein